MNTRVLRWLLAACLAGCFHAHCLLAQPFQIEHLGIGAGGGTSSGGNFTLTGSMGAIGAGVSSGGAFTLEGGDLSMFVVLQTPGAPALSLTRSGANAVLSWPASETGYILEQTANLTSPSWSGVGVGPVPMGDTLQVTVPITGTSRFFRLRLLAE